MHHPICPSLPLRGALKWLLAGSLLFAWWHADSATAEEKIELIEMPIPKKKAAVKSEAQPATATPPMQKASAPTAEPVAAAETEAPAGNDTVRQLKQALSAIGTPSQKAEESSKRITLTNSNVKRSAPVATAGAAGAAESRKYISARAMALANGEKPAKAHGASGDPHGGELHWSYEGETGPQNWGKLKPDYKLCSVGKRQSPIAIRDDITLLGPAEPINFVYSPSRGSVVNNGHTIQVDVEGENSITVRGSTYRLLQFHFHTPSEEMVNSKRSAMVAHLVHRNEAGQLAVVAVLMEPGEPNPMIDTVWTYMPLDTNDRVAVPEGRLDLNQILPADQRYYQFIGSLTTPPCTEGVLWMVLKQPLKISPAQLKVFTQLFPMNARPVQAINARIIREAK